MLLEKTYKSEIETYSYIRNNKKFIQNLSYYLAKDFNINNLVILMEELGNRKEFDEKFRREIIVNNFEDNIIYFKKILSVFIDFIQLKGSILNSNSFEDILKCCNVFPDNIGKRLLKQIGLYKIVLTANEIVNLFQGGKYTDEDLEEIKHNQHILRTFFSQIYRNEDFYLEYVKGEVENMLEQNIQLNNELYETFDNVISTLNKNISNSEIYNVEEIKSIFSSISTEGDVEEDKQIFLNELDKLLSFKTFVSTSKKLLKLYDDNTFVFIYYELILKTILEHKHK